MSKFIYTATGANGEGITGTVDEAELPSLNERLAECGFSDIRSRRVRVSTTKQARKISESEAALLARDLATIVSSGVPLGDGLRDLACNSPSDRRGILEAAAHQVESGTSLSTSLAECGFLFSDRFIGAVSAGERSGTLDETLPRLADYLEWRTEFRSKMIQALAYPIGLMVGATGLILLVALYLVPRLAAPLSNLGGGLPWITRFVLGGTAFLQQYGPAIVIVAAVSALFLILYRSSERGRVRTDALLLKIPWIGNLLLVAGGAEFTSTLSTLYKSGLPLPESLQLIEESTSNKAIAQRIFAVRRAVVGGGSLSHAAIANLHFPPLVGRLMSIGERTGSLDRCLERTTRQLERELKTSLRRITAIAEPAAILLAGGGIGIAVFAAIMPIFNMLESVRR